ncbi:MAG: N-acetyltransferase family protein [Verrucomicrobiota bacterium]
MTLDDHDDMALVGLIPAGGEQRFVAVARYHRNPATQWAEIGIVVREGYRRRGIGDFLLRRLAGVAREQGILGFHADVLAVNSGMLTLLRRLADPVEVTTHAGVTTVRFSLSDLRISPVRESHQDPGDDHNDAV